jgi:hypothetical protein
MKNMAENKKWYQNYAVKVTAIVVAISATLTLFGYISSGINWFSSQEELKQEVHILDSIVNTIIDGDQEVYEFIDKQSKSFAVGHRMKITIDEDGKPMWVKQYRGWDKRVHNIILDKELSEYYGREYYFYYDRNTQDKVYCP